MVSGQRAWRRVGCRPARPPTQAHARARTSHAHCHALQAAHAATLPDILPDSTEVASFALQHCADSVACLSALQNSLLL